ncbi:MAG: 2-polyprenyl-6-methoxyphenol hydroxylase-like oxidoreductase [Caulobacteraceae bacterium]|nr:2-polyprenyl-6-methoxyphenol hydroxylase-like oxidoreductase [Caulobacteraceae bacterium]
MLSTTTDGLREAAQLHAPAGVAGAPAVREVDVVVVGAGLSGSAAAVALARAGYRVALADRHAICPPQFRVEKFGGEQAESFRRLGLLEAIAAEATPFKTVMNLRRGVLIDQTHTPFYAIRYGDLVRVVRDQLPATATFLVDEVVDIQTRPEGQRVILGSDEVIDARLVVVATGMGEALWNSLGITRRATFEKHSVSFGFDLTPAQGSRFRYPALTYYGEGPADRIDYLTLFPMGDVTRANLFTFLDDRDPWFRAFRREPKATLLRTLPGLSSFLGDFQITSPVQAWVMNLYEVERHERDGVVLIGDAFQTNCPAAGIGVSRLLVDVERLCAVHAPRWLASPGMGRDKISEYYHDDVKQTSDRRALSLSLGRRLLTLDTSLQWRARRRQHFLRRRVVAWFRARRAAGGLDPA